MDRIRGTFIIVLIIMAVRWLFGLAFRNLGGLAIFLFVCAFLSPILLYIDRPYVGKVTPDMVEAHGYIDAPNWGFVIITNKSIYNVERVDMTCGGKQFVLLKNIKPNESRTKKFYSHALNTRGPISCEIDKIRS